MAQNLGTRVVPDIVVYRFGIVGADEKQGEGTVVLYIFFEMTEKVLAVGQVSQAVVASHVGKGALRPPHAPRENSNHSQRGRHSGTQGYN